MYVAYRVFFASRRIEINQENPLYSVVALHRSASRLAIDDVGKASGSTALSLSSAEDDFHQLHNGTIVIAIG